MPVFGKRRALAYGGGLVTAITLFFFSERPERARRSRSTSGFPDAMAGPTPVSALIHAATMVTAGVYLVARSSVLFALSPVASATVAGVGVLTALFAATIALKQNDIKKVLAYSTVSQLGYMFVGVGVGAYAAGVFHLMTHAFFKALLFLGSGAVIHAMHEAYHSHAQATRIRRTCGTWAGCREHMPITWITMWIATLAIAGIWPFAGFFSKDEIIWYDRRVRRGRGGPFPACTRSIWILALAAAMLTAFYMTRMMVMTFHGNQPHGRARSPRGTCTRPRPVMWVPLAVLAVLSVFGGWVNVPEALQTSWAGLASACFRRPSGCTTGSSRSPYRPHITIQLEHLGEVAHSAPFGGGEVLVGRDLHSRRGGRGRRLQAFRSVGSAGCARSPATGPRADRALAKVLATTSTTWTSCTTVLIVQPIVSALPILLEGHRRARSSTAR